MLKEGEVGGGVTEDGRGCPRGGGGGASGGTIANLPQQITIARTGDSDSPGGG